MGDSTAPSQELASQSQSERRLPLEAIFAPRTVAPAGFKEIGPEGAKLEQEVLEQAQ